MRMILGLDHPTSGTATIDGKPYRELANPLRTSGRCWTPSRPHPEPVGACAPPALRSRRLSGCRSAGVDEVLDMVGLHHGRRPERRQRLSLGMSQRLGIAAALLGDPPVLLFDEPVNGLDPEGIRWVRDADAHAWPVKAARVFVSSHLLSEMATPPTGWWSSGVAS